MLGGEWTTRRRTISESEIALFAALSGDFSPLAVDTSGGGSRQAPPALLVAMALGLGSMDTPIPQVSSWDWVNWKFPKAVRAGETIYARWTLTQKRPAVHGKPAAIAVWRVDVHTADGAVCAEGEIGASVFRRAAAQAEKAAEAAPAAPRGRRRRRRGSGQAVESPATPEAAKAAPEAAKAPPAERSSRRRRRKRSTGSGANGNNGGSSGNGGDHSSPPAPAAALPAPGPAPVAAAPAASGSSGALSRVMKRLRGS